MATKTWYATNSLVSVHQEMSETDPGTEAFASPVTGWVVGTTGTGTGAFQAQTESSTFSGTNPDGSINTTAPGDCLRSTNTYTGTFASANWTVNFCVRSNTVVAGQGRVGVRLFRSANADGSSATQITAAIQNGSTITSSTSTTTNSSIAFNPGSFSVSNEYIFIQIGWERITAGGMSTSDINMRVGNSASLGTRVVSSNFTQTFAVTTAFTGTTTAATSATKISPPERQPFTNFVHIQYNYQLLYPAIFTPVAPPPIVSSVTTTFTGLGQLTTAGVATAAAPTITVFQTFTAVQHNFSLLYPSLFETVRPGTVVAATTAVTGLGTMVTARTRIVPRTTAVTATGLLATAALRIENRTMVVTATAQMTTTYTIVKFYSRTTVVTATGQMASAASHTIPRTTAVSAVGALATARTHIVPRTTAVSATGAMASIWTLIKGRSMVVTALGAMATAWTKRYQRTMAVAANASVTSSAAHILNKTTAISATGTMVSARSHIIPRTMAVSAAAQMVSARTHTIPRTTVVTANGTLTTLWSMGGVSARNTAFTATGAMATVATRIRGRSSAFAGAGSVLSTAIVTRLRTTVFSGVGVVGSAADLIPGEVGETFERTTQFGGTSVIDSVAIRQPRPTAIIYQFPIGKSLGSDYGRRGSQMAARYGYRPKIRSGSYR